MTTFPITYIEIVIWLIFINIQNDNYWIRVVIKMCGGFMGFWIAILTFTGEQWLIINESTPTLTLSTFNDGYQYPMALFVLVISITLWIMLAYSVAQRDWAKDDANK